MNLSAYYGHNKKKMCFKGLFRDITYNVLNRISLILKLEAVSVFVLPLLARLLADETYLTS